MLAEVLRPHCRRGTNCITPIKKQADLDPAITNNDRGDIVVGTTVMEGTVIWFIAEGGSRPRQ